MRANPGGQLDPKDVIGRDGLIAQLWDMLDRQSVVLTAERRIGKTQLIKKMERQAPEGVLPIFRDLENLRTPVEFAERVFEDVEGYLKRKDRVAIRARQFLAKAAGAEVGDIVKLPEHLGVQWKTFLEKTVEDLVEHQDRQVIFFWDELPMMVYNIKVRAGDAAAMELLDVLRHLRQTHDTLRMVFTGSIGLQNIIDALREEGYVNAPTNDMRRIDVPPLAPEDGRRLARMLIDGEKIETAMPEETAARISDAVDHVAYYIHHVVGDLKFRPGPHDAEGVTALVEARLRSAQDEWEMSHFHKRIGQYYRPAHARIALDALDSLAHDGPLAFADLFDRLKSRRALADDEADTVRHVLTLLQRDHYLVLGDTGYGFRFPLIRRWWQIHRG